MKKPNSCDLGRILMMVLVVSVFSKPVHGDLIFSHFGTSDPTSEGWTLTSGGGGTSGPVDNDLGLGVDAWAVGDTSLILIGDYYTQSPSAAQSAAIANGWKLSTTVRVVEGTTGTFDSPFVAFSQGTIEFTVVFDTQSDGDPVVRLSEGGNSGTEYAIEGVGNETYHTYDLLYDPLSGSADLFVDGIERISDYTGQSSATSRVAWGAGASNGTGLAHFHAVSFSAVPEPSSFALVGLGIASILGLNGRSRRRRR